MSLGFKLLFGDPLSSLTPWSIHQDDAGRLLQIRDVLSLAPCLRHLALGQPAEAHVEVPLLLPGAVPTPHEEDVAVVHVGEGDVEGSQGGEVSPGVRGGAVNLGVGGRAARDDKPVDAIVEAGE